MQSFQKIHFPIVIDSYIDLSCRVTRHNGALSPFNLEQRVLH